MLKSEFSVTENLPFSSTEEFGCVWIYKANSSAVFTEVSNSLTEICDLTNFLQELVITDILEKINYRNGSNH